MFLGVLAILFLIAGSLTLDNTIHPSLDWTDRMAFRSYLGAILWATGVLLWIVFFTHLLT